MKKILIFVLSIILILPIAQADFSDIHGKNSKKAIEYLMNNNVVKGYSDGTFRPEQNITRAEFLKIVLESSGNYVEGCTEPSVEFSDVSMDDWFFEYVCYGVNNEIITGYSDGTFHPEQNINFAEASKIVANVFSLETEEIEGEWYEKFVSALNRERVISGSVAGNYAFLSRGEMAEMVWGISTGDEVKNDRLGDLPEIASCAELETQIKKYRKRNNIGNIRYKSNDMELMMVNAVEEADFTTGAVAKSADEYSTTNIQEFGVDEADIIKNDGSHIFLIKDNTVRIIRAYPPEEMKEEAIISIADSNFYPREMYLDNDRLVIIGDGTGAWHIEEESASIAPCYDCYPNSNDLKVVIFDISDRANPKQIRSVSMEAQYTSSRKIGDIVYLIANKYEYYYDLPEQIILPKFSDTNFLEEENVAKCSEVHYFPNFSDSNYLIVASIDIRDMDKKTNRKVFLGSSDEIYASTKNLYITRPVYKEVYIEENGNESWIDGQFTEIFKFALDDGNIDFIAKNNAEGRILNQFSMSEYSDYFRIATQKGQAWGRDLSESMITIFDENLEEIGKIDGIAPGENMKSARFIGNKVYLVTFKTVDPLFVIDLDPTNPKILGKLKIPGWSDYLHPYDENHLIGFGKEVDESIDADKVHSDDAIYYTAVLGMKLSIFDVSDLENPKEIHKEVIGYRGTTSEVLNNHKALLFDKDKGILAFPITVTAHMNDTHGYEADIETIFAGAYVYNIDLENGFSFRGKVSNYDDNDDVYIKSGEYFWGEDGMNIDRIIYIGDYFYSVSDNIIKALSWDDISEIKSLEID
jgi:uncharacterized secreted protein with C-terminal beta-propeller domain